MPDSAPVPIVEHGLTQLDWPLAATTGLATQTPIGAGSDRRAMPPPAHANRHCSAGADPLEFVAEHRRGALVISGVGCRNLSRQRHRVREPAAQSAGTIAIQDEARDLPLLVAIELNDCSLEVNGNFYPQQPIAKSLL